MSPSMRREWIEISTMNEYVQEHKRLPPCGGSGLKWAAVGAWVLRSCVSLHAEGVD